MMSTFFRNERSLQIPTGKWGSAAVAEITSEKVDSGASAAADDRALTHLSSLGQTLGFVAERTGSNPDQQKAVISAKQQFDLVLGELRKGFAAAAPIGIEPKSQQAVPVKTDTDSVTPLTYGSSRG